MSNEPTLDTPESAGAMLARLGTDAQLWAREFIKLAPSIDEYTMICWFANAIGAGESKGYSKGREPAGGTA